jgi:ABC-type branched-subunit amino acid transport system substrate-binding protein
MKWIFALFVVGLFLFSGCGGEQPQEEVAEEPAPIVVPPVPQPVIVPAEKIYIGFVGPLSGDHMQEGSEALNSLTLSASELSDKKYEYVVLSQDGGCSAAGAATAIDALSAQGVNLVVGGVCPEEVDGMAPKLQQAGVMLLSLSTGSVDNEYIMNFAGSPDALGEQMVLFAINKGWRRPMTVTDGSADALKRAALFDAASKAHTISALPAEKYDSNFAATAMKIKNDVPEAVIVFTSDAAVGAKIVKGLRDAGVTAPIMGDWVLVSNSGISEMGTNAEGVYGVLPEFDENDAAATFYLNGYSSRYGVPQDKVLVGNARNAMYLLAQAESFYSYRPSVDELKQYWINLESWMGIGGTINFQSGDRVASFRFVKVSGGAAQPA